MIDKLKTVQLRSTIFISQNVGYVPEVAAKLKEFLLPNGQIKGIMFPATPIMGDASLPQWGMPWSLYVPKDTNPLYNITFLPGKIDIIMNKDVTSTNGTESDFINKCNQWFKKICEYLNETNISRIAYAPSYSVSLKDFPNIWNTFIKVSPFEGSECQDNNLSFLYKKVIQLKNKDIQVNLLQNIFDAYKTAVVNETETTEKLVMLQLDLNTVPKNDYKFNIEEIEDFFLTILDIKNSLLKSFLK